MLALTLTTRNSIAVFKSRAFETPWTIERRVSINVVAHSRITQGQKFQQYPAVHIAFERHDLA